LAEFFGSTCLWGSDYGYSFPSTGATHPFPAALTRFVDVIFGCADLLLRALRPGVVWTCASLATIGVPIARALDLQRYIGQLYHTGAEIAKHEAMKIDLQQRLDSLQGVKAKLQSLEKAADDIGTTLNNASPYAAWFAESF
jgi:hypothetical protein